MFFPCPYKVWWLTGPFARAWPKVKVSSLGEGKSFTQVFQAGIRGLHPERNPANPSGHAFWQVSKRPFLRLCGEDGFGGTLARAHSMNAARGLQRAFALMPAFAIGL